MAPKVTSREILRRLPNASKAFLQRNAEDHSAALPAKHAEPTEGGALECLPEGKKASSHSPNERIGLAFRAYAMRPADPDGWDFKELIDALVGAKILDGDGWDRFYIAGVRSEKVHAKDQERTEISIIYPTKTPVGTEMTRAQLLESYWQQCGRACWNREAFDAFMETLSDEDLRHYMQMGH